MVNLKAYIFNLGTLLLVHVFVIAPIYLVISVITYIMFCPNGIAEQKKVVACNQGPLIDATLAVIIGGMAAFFALNIVFKKLNRPVNRGRLAILVLTWVLFQICIELFLTPMVGLIRYFIVPPLYLIGMLIMSLAFLSVVDEK